MKVAMRFFSIYTICSYVNLLLVNLVFRRMSVIVHTGKG